MSKIFIVFFFLCSFIEAQTQVIISKLNGDINSDNSEINFVQINDSTAYFTKFFTDNNNLKSSIVKAKNIDGKWLSMKNNYNNYNSGNLTLTPFENISYITRCNFDYTFCNLFRVNGKDTTSFNKINTEAFTNKYNSQPSFFTFNGQFFLAFVSDREGGYGGLDIWFSVIDKSGNIGMPINAGKTINTSFDEISPFYNEIESKLYFSSNRETKNLGGYDIYSSSGYPNKWNKSNNLFDFNTTKDEMYFTFYDKFNGYFSSNRNSDCNFLDSCCADIFYFKILKEDTLQESVDSSYNFTSYLPLSLYFDNDKPSISDFKTFPQYNYKSSYIDYFMNFDRYNRYNSSYAGTFFEDSLKGNFNRLNELIDILYQNLIDGYNITIKIRGYASQLADEKYNVKISSMRIKSLLNYFSTFKNGVLKPYFLNQSLNVIEAPLGESESAEAETNDAIINIYGSEAMLNRKVSILKIDSYK